MHRLSALIAASLLVACSSESESPRVFIDGEGTVAERFELAVDIATKLSENARAGVRGEGRVGTDDEQTGDIGYSAGYSTERFLWFEETERTYISCNVPDGPGRAALAETCIRRIAAALAAHRGNKPSSGGGRSD